MLLGATAGVMPVLSQVVITEPPRNYSAGLVLDDLLEIPLSFALTVSDSAIVSVTRVEVGLHLVGATPESGFAGEMFVSLNRNLGASSVLINGVGITGSDGVGLGYDGWNVSFRDDASNGDVHVANPGRGVLSGAWAPDGRVRPADVSRPLGLDVFTGQAGNGVWHLNVADLELGGRMRLESWSLALTGFAAVPEPETWAVFAGGFCVVSAVCFRRRATG